MDSLNTKNSMEFISKINKHNNVIKMKWDLNNVNFIYELLLNYNVLVSKSIFIHV